MLTRAGRPVNPLLEHDWMQELEFDAVHVQAVMGRIHELGMRALHANQIGDKLATGHRVGEMLEGVELLCKLFNVVLPH
jgi:hypothetical protein